MDNFSMSLIFQEKEDKIYEGLTTQISEWWTEMFEGSARIDLPELVNKKEWVNTRIIWDLSTRSDSTLLKVTHMGLTSKAECYALCSSGWQSFLYSFNKFITTGVGTPFTLAEAD